MNMNKKPSFIFIYYFYLLFLSILCCNQLAFSMEGKPSNKILNDPKKVEKEKVALKKELKELHDEMNDLTNITEIKEEITEMKKIIIDNNNQISSLEKIELIKQIDLLENKLKEVTNERKKIDDGVFKLLSSF